MISNFPLIQYDIGHFLLECNTNSKKAMNFFCSDMTFSTENTRGRLNKIPVIRSHFVIFICATNCFDKMWYLIQWKVGFYSYGSGISFREMKKWSNLDVLIQVFSRILFSRIDKKWDLINLFWDPIQWISCLKQQISSSGILFSTIHMIKIPSGILITLPENVGLSINPL